MNHPAPERAPGGAYPWQEIASRWSELVPDVCRRWPEITYMEALAVAGQRGRLCSLIGRRYGVSHEEADDMLFGWQATLARQEASRKASTRTD